MSTYRDLRRGESSSSLRCAVEIVARVDVGISATLLLSFGWAIVIHLFSFFELKTLDWLIILFGLYIFFAIFFAEVMVASDLLRATKSNTFLEVSVRHAKKWQKLNFVYHLLTLLGGFYPQNVVKPEYIVLPSFFVRVIAMIFVQLFIQDLEKVMMSRRNGAGQTQNRNVVTV